MKIGSEASSQRGDSNRPTLQQAQPQCRGAGSTEKTVGRTRVKLRHYIVHARWTEEAYRNGRK
jgi:hypothetical protein